ncbi:MAG: InlB B-repeat-containing protein [Clostridia bacterium]|nr:InlB B-repeat-containing protein [Clostridia bacterium]
MSSTAEYLTQLISDRDDLADNLVTMGVQATHSETITELVPKVLDIAGGGGGVEITDVTLNADGTYTVTDAEENTHTLAVTVTNGQITAITYDGDNVPLTFASGLLTKVGDTDIDIDRYPNPEIENIGYYVKFKVNNDDYYIVSCQQGESITEPPTPTVQSGYAFIGWKDSNDNPIVFPYTPTADIELSAVISAYNFYVSNGGLICTLNGKNCNPHTQPSGAIEICAYGVFTTYCAPLLITTNTRTHYLRYTNASGNFVYENQKTTVEYNGTTYNVAAIVNQSVLGTGEDTSGLVRYKFTNQSGSAEANLQAAATEVLNAVFGATE